MRGVLYNTSSRIIFCTLAFSTTCDMNSRYNHLIVYKNSCWFIITMVTMQCFIVAAVAVVLAAVVAVALVSFVHLLPPFPECQQRCDSPAEMHATMMQSVC